MIPNRRYVFRSPLGLGTALRCLLVATIVLSCVNTAATAARLRSGSWVISVGPGSPPPEALGPSLGALSSIASLVAISTVVVWLVWQWRVTANVWARGREIATTPGWAVGWWFVPFANLVMPAVAMARVYRASREDGDRSTSLVVSWWLLYTLPILGIVVFVFRAIQRFDPYTSATGVTTVDLTPIYRDLGTWMILWLPFAVAGGALAFVLVSRITDAQEQGSRRDWVPPRPDVW